MIQVKGIYVFALRGKSWLGATTMAIFMKPWLPFWCAFGSMKIGSLQLETQKNGKKRLLFICWNLLNENTALQVQAATAFNRKLKPSFNEGKWRMWN